MNASLQTALFTAILMVSAYTLAASPGQIDAAQTMAQKDHQAALARIASVSEADQKKCAEQTGPAAKACTIQQEGKRFSAEEEAQLAFSRAGEPVPKTNEDQEKASKTAVKKAKVDYGVAKARIKSDRNLASAECAKLKGDERSRCKKDVESRYSDAKRFASSTYDRAVAKAEAIVSR